MADWIHVEQLEVEAVVGILEAEQRTTQLLVFDVDLKVDLAGAVGGSLEASVNYASVADAVSFLAAHGRFRLLESLGHAVCALALAPPAPGAPAAPVEEVVVRIRKPEILPDCVPGITMQRTADACELGTRMVPEKTWLDTLVETTRVGAYRAHVEPGSGWTVPADAALLVVAGTFKADGDRVLEPGMRVARGEVQRLVATSTVPATMLVVMPPSPGAPVA